MSIRLASEWAMPGIRHYMGDSYCRCGARNDPETGYCGNCEPELVLYRIAVFSRDWLAHSEEPPPAAPVKVASEANVGRFLQEMLDADSDLIVIQRLR